MQNFPGEQIGDGGIYARKCPLNHHNAKVVRKYFPWTVPVPVGDKPLTVGLGDRIGLATLGHVAAVNGYNITPVLAQQSVRELQMTGRTFFDVIDDVTFQVFEAGYQSGYGADADHLKTIGDIDTASAAGMTFFTIDISDRIHQEALKYDEEKLNKAFKKLPEEIQKKIEAEYFDKEFSAGGKNISFDVHTAKLCAVLYHTAIDFGIEAANHLREVKDGPYDLEICFDEIDFATPPEHHFFIASELISNNVRFTSIAPCFSQDFEQAIAYKGNSKEFGKIFAIHFEIAEHFQCKLSVHSGSGKVALFEMLTKITGGKFHIKLSGTSWLEAVKLIAAKDPVLFKIIYNCARSNVDRLKQIYHVSPDIDSIPEIDNMYDDQLASLFDIPSVKQMLYVGFGAILKDKTIQPLLIAALHKHEKEYVELLKDLYQENLAVLGVTNC